jgi:hypothetical protein
MAHTQTPLSRLHTLSPRAVKALSGLGIQTCEQLYARGEAPSARRSLERLLGRDVDLDAALRECEKVAHFDPHEGVPGFGAGALIPGD